MVFKLELNFQAVMKEAGTNVREKICTLKISALWDTAPCSLVEVQRRFIGAYCLHHEVRTESLNIISASND
jgi:hypothetical protein